MVVLIDFWPIPSIIAYLFAYLSVMNIYAKKSENQFLLF